MPETPVLYVLNGPNLNLLGCASRTSTDTRPWPTSRRGAKPLPRRWATIVFRQSNHEGELIDWVQEARTEASRPVINPAGYGHTSVALLDALKALTIPDHRMPPVEPGRARGIPSTPMFHWPPPA
jgi:3-dehydroquinate dehydratase-2